MITEAGPVKILSEPGNPLIESIRNRVRISLEKHGSRVIAIAAHGDCAGNPVSKDEHLAMLKRALENMSRWFDGIELIGLWVDSMTRKVRRVY